MLIIVANHVRVLADSRATRRNATTVELVRACGADDAVVGRRTIARLTEGRALLARGAVAEAAVGTLGSPGSCLLRSKALRSVIRALRETGATCDTVAGTIGALLASQGAD